MISPTSGRTAKGYRPVMLHRVVFGSIERFIGILTEHFAGAFPAWFTPVQVCVMPIAARHAEYARQIEKSLDEKGIRVENDTRNEKNQLQNS
ncbi:MAG: His/Gly/Thr/Pro-type tRNA ligase C-terminal domain-containing protein [Candidatus Syntrophopropionicum ammoniitolerans]